MSSDEPKEVTESQSHKIGFGDHFAGVVRDPNGDVEGFSETVRDGQVASADRTDDGLIDFSFLGNAPQNEEDTLKACKTLIKALNIDGAEWGDPVEGTGDEIDCIAEGISDESALTVQLVRGIAETDFWRELGIEKRIERVRVQPATLADEMRKAIGKKSQERPIPMVQRRRLILALDAGRTPALAFDAVIDSFKERHGEWTNQQGFCAVWVVGPTPQLCRRLDFQT